MGSDCFLCFSCVFTITFYINSIWPIELRTLFCLYRPEEEKPTLKGGEDVTMMDGWMCRFMNCYYKNKSNGLLLNCNLICGIIEKTMDDVLITIKSNKHKYIRHILDSFDTTPSGTTTTETQAGSSHVMVTKHKPSQICVHINKI